MGTPFRPTRLKSLVSSGGGTQEITAGNTGASVSTLRPNRSLSSTHFALPSPVSRLIGQRFRSGTPLSGLDTGLEGGLDVSWAQGGHPATSLTFRVSVAFARASGSGGRGEAPEGETLEVPRGSLVTQAAWPGVSPRVARPTPSPLYQFL